MQVCSGRDAGDSPFAWVTPNEQMSKIIYSLHQFLAWRGFKGETPYRWARCFYKYTDCGPWAVFLVKTKEASEEVLPAQVASFKEKDGMATLVNSRELTPDFVRFLGFDKDGLSKKERTWGDYNRLIDEFIADEAKQVRTGRELEVISRDLSRLVVRLPGSTKAHPMECDEIYYEDKQVMEFDLDTCAGIKFGSIVEGSDACAGPYTHMFPFETEAWDRDEAHMEAETSFYWERDNGSWYIVRNEHEEWMAVNAWGDISWKGETPPDDIKEAAEAAIHNDWQEDPEHSSCVVQTIPEMIGIYEIKPEHKNWKALSLGETGAEIYTFNNDTIYD